MFDRINKDMSEPFIKEVISELKALKRMEQVQLDILQRLLPNEPVIQEYNHMVAEQYGINITYMNTYYVIHLPKLMSRKKEFITKPLYLKTLNEMVKENRQKSFTSALLVFNHIFPVSKSSSMRDNDNYNSNEIKHIIDCLVDGGLIDNDKGVNCSILHISTLEIQREVTELYVIDDNSEDKFEVLRRLMDNSKTINKDITDNYNA